MKKLEEIIKVAKRDKNNKRSFLLVNTLQGKHYPISPRECCEILKKLSDKFLENNQIEESLIIGFAETATAIANFFAIELSKRNTNIYLILTTREEYLEEKIMFSEVHSHATEQKIYIKNLDEIIEKKIKRIIFVEDEITTGNTILNLKRILESRYKNKIEYSAVSILNGMSDENLKLFQNEKIKINYLFKNSNINYDKILETYKYLGKIVKKNNVVNDAIISQVIIGKYINPRKVVEVKKLEKKYKELLNKILRFIEKDQLKNKKILVLGAEEFMYPALVLAEYIEKNYGCNCVKFHATTRSPILPSCENEYPIKSRFELESLYEKDRRIFVYNLERYDKVYIMHDSEKNNKHGIETLGSSLSEVGCKEILFIQWRDEE